MMGCILIRREQKTLILIVLIVLPLVSNDGLSSMTLSSVLTLHFLVLSMTVRVLLVVILLPLLIYPFPLGLLKRKCVKNKSIRSLHRNISSQLKPSILFLQPISVKFCLLNVRSLTNKSFGGVGLVVIHRRDFSCSSVSFGRFSSFESLIPSEDLVT